MQNIKTEKKLRPTLRENKRYLLLEGDFSREDIERAILDYIGVLGYAKSGVFFIRKNGKNILAVNREMANEVRASLALYEKTISVIKVSGTLKGLGK